jgi:PQQ-dependent catabolism-associated CXXCW motif protein
VTVSPAAAPSVTINASSLELPLPKGVDTTTGFRMSRYRAPVPETNPGTEVVSTERAFELFESGAVKFVDVYPPKGLGANPVDGTWMTNEKHQSIEGAIWLPEVGRGHIEQEHIDYFQRNLTLITNNDKTTPLIFYCTADCKARSTVGLRDDFLVPGRHRWLARTQSSVSTDRTCKFPRRMNSLRRELYL